MVQTFALFADRSAAAKIRTAKLWMVHVCIVRMRSDRAKIKTTKISSKGLISNSAKICTSENFPLYGTSHCVSLASVIKELNFLKETVRTLKGEVTSLHREKQTLRAPSMCHISIACKTPYTATELPSLLGCPILNTAQVGRYWKAKIHGHCLYDALQSTSDTHSVHIWENNHPRQPPPLPSLSNSPSLIQGKLYQLLHGIVEAITTANHTFLVLSLRERIS